MTICIIGAFGFDSLPTGGQPVKTRSLYRLLSENYGKDNISYIETYGWKRHPIKMIRLVKKAVNENDVVIMLPAHNGVKIFTPMLLKFAKRKKTRLFYDVIGGWLAEKISNDLKLAKELKHFDGIWVETSNMKSALEEQGFKNVTVIPNFKFIEPLKKEDLYMPKKPYKLCTFSRIMKEKGIEDAINAVIEINSKQDENIFILDIYGPIDEGYQFRFKELQNNFPEYIKYNGVVEPDKSVSVLKDYCALLFPTHFNTEGIPGTIIDAYTAGVPIITAKWKNCEDIFADGITGWGYEQGNYNALVEKLEELKKNPQCFNEMRINCLKKAQIFSPSKVINTIVNNISG